MANKLLSNLGIAVGDLLSASIELQTRVDLAVNLRIQVLFMDNSDVVVSGGTFDGEVVDEIYNDYAASLDTDGPWFRSRLFNMTVPAGSIKINIGYAYDSTVIGTITASRKPILNRGSKPAQYSPPADNIVLLPVATLASADHLAFHDDSDDIARRALVSSTALSLFKNEVGNLSHLSSAPSSTANVIDLDMDNGSVFEIILDENITTTTISNLSSGTNKQVITLKISQDGVGGFTFAFPSGTIWAGGSAPTVTSAASAKDLFELTTFDNGTSFYGEIIAQNLS